MATGAHASGPTGLAPHSSPSTSSPTITLSPQARRTFQESFSRFEKTVAKRSKNDEREFADTTLRDVWAAVREIEQQLAARQCLRNLKRLEPLLNGLEAYSKVVEVLCNGTPFMPWIWAPIKLMMKLASDHISAFETLVSAYAQIAENLPRFDRLSNAFRNHPDFQQIIAVVYSDILEFHRQAYKFFRKSGWKSFFKSSWGQFDSRFGSILASMQRHASLVDKEANAYSIAEVMTWRKEAREAAVKVEKERSAAKLAATLSWLGIDQIPGCGQSYQDNTLNRLSDDCCPGTTDWTSRHPRTKVWFQDKPGPSFLWLKGKPGSGKSTIVARIAQSLRSYTTHRRRTLLCCFYGYSISSVHSEPVMFILATLVSQILRQNIKLSTYVYEEFVAAARSPSTRELRHILSELIPQLDSPRILIDGIDECIHYGSDGSPRNLAPVKDVISAILQLENYGNGSSSPKILLASRDIFQITSMLSKKPVLSLDDESDIMTNAIRCFTKQGFREIEEKFESFPNAQSILDQVETRIVSKSQGIFLWVRLVLLHLEQYADSIDDLEKAVGSLPVTLNEFYDRILARLDLLDTIARGRVLGAINWMLCARRPLRAVELQDAIIFAMGSETLTEKNKLSVTVLGHCKPLIQLHPDGHVSFVHFTVQEFLNASSVTNPLESERCVVASCLRYLNHSLTLTPQDNTAGSAAIEIGKCLHILHPYVHEHWLDHLLSLAAKCDDTHDRQLEEMLSRLLGTINRHQQQDSRSIFRISDHDHEAILKMEPRLNYMRRYGGAFKACVETVQYRHVRKLQFHNATSSDTLSDPTPFSKIKAEYEIHVNTLLSTSAFPGLSSAELAIFHSLHHPFSLTCRYPGCTNFSAGFATHIDRDRHEKSHAPPLLCVYSGCKYTLPFNSSQSLKRHIRESHDCTSRRIQKGVRSSRGHNTPSRSRFAQTHGVVELLPQSGVADSHSPSTSFIGFHSLSPHYSTERAHMEYSRFGDLGQTPFDSSEGPDYVYSAITQIIQQLERSQDSWANGIKILLAKDMGMTLMKKKLASGMYLTLQLFLLDFCREFRLLRNAFTGGYGFLREEVSMALNNSEDSMWDVIRQLKPAGDLNPKVVLDLENSWRLASLGDKSVMDPRENRLRPSVFVDTSPFNHKRTVVPERTISPKRTTEIVTTHTNNSPYPQSEKPSQFLPPATDSPELSTSRSSRRHSLLMALESTDETPSTPLLSRLVHIYNSEGVGVDTDLNWHHLLQKKRARSGGLLLLYTS